MSEKIDINHVHSVCDSCAESLGWTRKDKAVGVWMGKCGICGERKPLTSLWHDWDPPKKEVK